MDTSNFPQKSLFNSPKREWETFLHSRLLILAMLFGVTGFLGLPILWMSPAFSKWEKYLWSVVNILYTCALIAICGGICWWAFNRILSDG